jgi:hypothetical protein
MKTIAKSDHLTLGMGKKTVKSTLNGVSGPSQGGSAGHLAACLADGAAGKGIKDEKKHSKE